MCDNSSRLPVPLRRSPRHSARRLHASTSPSQRHPRQHAVSKASSTPRKTKKGTRPFETNSIIVRNVENGPITPPTTGRQRSVQRSISTTMRRKYTKTPSLATPNTALRSLGHDSCGTMSGSNEVRIFPLRAILDDRVKRRIRRNGLSEEMNMIYGERKQRAKRNVEEMQRLRDQLTAKELENDELREQSSLLQDTSRILELEREISELRQGLHGHSFGNVVDDSWDMAAADGFTDGGSFSDMDDRFRDDTTLEVDSADSLAPEKEKPCTTDTLQAFTPPNTSPTRSTSPDYSRPSFPPANCDVGVQASLRDAGRASLDAEVTQLRHKLISLQEAFEANEKLESQLRAQITTMQNTKATAEVDPDLQLQTDIMLQTLAEKTAALNNINSWISTLGSPDTDPSEILSILTNAFHAARQELEHIFPDENPTPMPLDAPAVLGTMLQCLRELAAQAKEYESWLEDSCTREQHLREQLTDRMDAMDTMSSKLREKDDRIFRLEADLEECEVVVGDCQKSLVNASHAVEQNNAELAELQAKLGSMVSVAAELQTQFAQLQVEKEIELTANKSAYDEELRMRDAKLLELHEEITALKEALMLARDSTSKLQSENARLQGVADRDKKIARDTVAALRTQLLQSLQTSEAFLA